MLKRAALACGIAVSPSDVHIREQLFQLRFNLLCALAYILYVHAVALRTYFRRRSHIVAVVTDQAGIEAMIGQGDIAIDTLEGFATGSAQGKGREAAPIQ